MTSLPSSFLIVTYRLLLDYVLSRLLIITEVDADTVDTVPLIRRRRVTLALEHVSQMTATIATHYLRPRHAECTVRVPSYSSGHSIEESWPSTSTLELVLRGIEGCIAADAVISSLARSVFVVFASEGGFGSLFAEDSELFWV